MGIIQEDFSSNPGGNAPAEPQPTSPYAPPGYGYPSYEGQIPPQNDAIQGLSADEKLDPNKINVKITDGRTPIVVLFGPPSSGKTMILIRLTRWLKKNGYSVTPVRTFRPAEDLHYKKLCDDFNRMVDTTEAMPSTNLISFMLLSVTDRDGRDVCQILEAPGEHYFDPNGENDDLEAPFIGYINEIAVSSTRKLWLILTEPDKVNAKNRPGYVTRIGELLQTVNHKTNSFAIVYNKVDLSRQIVSAGKVNTKEAKRAVENLYPGIFSLFVNEHPISRYWRKSNADFAVFQSGTFPKAADGTRTYQSGPDEYPARLWRLILDFCRG